MNDNKKMSTGAVIIATVIVFAAVLAGFYGLDHFVMGIQGLPLNSDLTPAG
ncbi:MAG: hypothetical protein GY934_23225 [Gammaproteobacteria bacterium]|nr:hypothetical protein [Gammaproteobacteria bacterium]